MLVRPLAKQREMDPSARTSSGTWLLPASIKLGVVSLFAAVIRIPLRIRCCATAQR